MAEAVNWNMEVFPQTRKKQGEFLTTLAGEALLRGDHPGWLLLMECAACFTGSPELDSAAGQNQKRNVMSRLDDAIQQTKARNDG